jgi:GNAT superfamily N-acetyltransferase
MAYHKYSYDIFGQVGKDGSHHFFGELWKHKNNRFSHSHSFLGWYNGSPVSLMTCYPQTFVEKLVNPTLWQLIRIGRLRFIGHLLTHLSNFYYFTHMESSADDFYIATLAVLPEYRSKGVGAKMLKFARNLAKERGFRYCSLHVSADNGKGLRFYENNGFKKANSYEAAPAYYRMVYPL